MNIDEINDWNDVENWTADRIRDTAIAMGANGSQSRVIGIYIEGGLEIGAGAFGGGGETIRFVGVDTQTEEKVIAQYSGVTVSAGASLLGKSNFGGGVFSFTGTPESLGGWSVGIQMSAGITTGVSTNVDGSGILSFSGSNFSAGANLAGGYTYRVTFDDQVIFDLGPVYQSGFVGAEGFDFQDLMNSVVNSSSGVAVLETRVPNEDVIVRRTFQRTAKGGDGYTVNMIEKAYDLDGNPLSPEAAAEFIEDPHKVKKVYFVEEDGSCFAAGTPIEMADGTTKPIEDVEIGDKVLAFDPAEKGGRGKKIPKRVTQLHRTENQILINFHGTQVTPGHAYLTGEGSFLPIIEILQNDGTVVKDDGQVIRARTGYEVGSKEDIAIPIGYPDGDEIKLTHMRAGTLYGGKDGKAFTIEQMMNSRGYLMMTDGRFIGEAGDVKTAYWEWGVPDDKMIAGEYADYAELLEGATIGLGMPLMPSRPN